MNRLAGKKIAVVGNKPGVTKGQQWLKSNKDLEILDTPGILWNKFEDMRCGLNLAFTGAVKDDVVDIETLALELLKFLREKYPESLETRYNIEICADDSPLEIYGKVCKRRGFILRGGDFDYERCAKILLDEFRGGKLGRISLEEP